MFVISLQKSVENSCSIERWKYQRNTGTVAHGLPIYWHDCLDVDIPLLTIVKLSPIFYKYSTANILSFLYVMSQPLAMNDFLFLLSRRPILVCIGVRAKRSWVTA